MAIFVQLRFNLEKSLRKLGLFHLIKKQIICRKIHINQALSALLAVQTLVNQP